MNKASGPKPGAFRLRRTMSDLQDKLDRGEITPEEFFDAWDAEMEEKERLHPGIHGRWYESLIAKYTGIAVAADEFFRLKSGRQKRKSVNSDKKLALIR
jgi:hypothetical protein